MNRLKICISLDPEIVREVESLKPRNLAMSRKVEGLIKAGLKFKEMWENTK